MNYLLGRFKPLSTPLGRASLFLFAIIGIGGATSAHAQTRKLFVLETAFERGTQGTVVMEMDVVGDENTVGFSITFNTSQLTFVSASLPTDFPAGGLLLVNDTQKAAGRVGFAVSAPFGTHLAAGRRRLVDVKFAALATGPSNAVINIGDVPIPREYVREDATLIPVGDVTIEAGTILIYGRAANASAASYGTIAFAPQSIVAVFGNNFAPGLALAPSIPLPTSLLGTTLRFVDSAGVSRDSELLFVSPNQCNYVIPSGVASGLATLIVTSSDGYVSIGTAFIAPVAPGLFSANVSGVGVAAAQIYRLRGTAQTIEEVASYDPGANAFVPNPIDMGPAEDQLVLVLYGTGFRFNSGTGGVSVTLGGTTVPVGYANIAPGYVGLDQINVGVLPRSLIGRGIVNIVVKVDGFEANTLTMEFK